MDCIKVFPNKWQLVLEFMRTKATLIACSIAMLTIGLWKLTGIHVWRLRFITEYTSVVVALFKYHVVFEKTKIIYIKIWRNQRIKPILSRQFTDHRCAEHCVLMQSLYHPKCQNLHQVKPKHQFVGPEIHCQRCEHQWLCDFLCVACALQQQPSFLIRHLWFEFLHCGVQYGSWYLGLRFHRWTIRRKKYRLKIVFRLLYCRKNQLKKKKMASRRFEIIIHCVTLFRLGQWDSTIDSMHM